MGTIISLGTRERLLWRLSWEECPGGAELGEEGDPGNGWTRTLLPGASTGDGRGCRSGGELGDIRKEGTGRHSEGALQPVEMPLWAQRESQLEKLLVP